jgi:hypothetical protein
MTRAIHHDSISHRIYATLAAHPGEWLTIGQLLFAANRPVADTSMPPLVSTRTAGHPRNAANQINVLIAKGLIIRMATAEGYRYSLDHINPKPAPAIAPPSSMRPGRRIGDQAA